MVVAAAAVDLLRQQTLLAVVAVPQAVPQAVPERFLLLVLVVVAMALVTGEQVVAGALLVPMEPTHFTQGVVVALAGPL